MNNPKRKVMVLMSTYNGEKYLSEQIESILSQDGVNVVLRVRDDGSNDNTVRIVKSYCQKHDNVELFEGSNVGFAMSFMELVYSAGMLSDIDYYAFSDQDDVWQSDKLLAAVNMLDMLKETEHPTLYFSVAKAVDENLKFLFDYCRLPSFHVTKPSSLVKCYMLGCTMVFSASTVRFLCKYKPVGVLQMHDLWINQTCAFFGKIVYDSTPHILYRQHSNNTAGVSNDIKIRIKRTIASFKTYEKRHFRELNAKCFLETYGKILTAEDKEYVQTVAFYRKSLKNRLRLLFSEDYSMGVLSSNLLLKTRIILGFL